jgi:hypothetical protein
MSPPRFPKESSMADDKTNRGSPDRDRINLSQEHEVRYWSEKFGVSAEQLKDAVRQAGPTADAVERQLRGR